MTKTFLIRVIKRREATEVVKTHFYRFHEVNGGRLKIFTKEMILTWHTELTVRETSWQLLINIIKQIKIKDTSINEEKRVMKMTSIKGYKKKSFYGQSSGRWLWRVMEKSCLDYRIQQERQHLAPHFKYNRQEQNNIPSSRKNECKKWRMYWR